MRLASLDLNKSYTYSDYYKWNFDERVELINGRIFEMSPAPNRIHKELAGEIYRKLGNFLHDNHYKVYIAPFNVRLPRKSNDDKDMITVLQPDLCVICDLSKLDYRGCIGGS